MTQGALCSHMQPRQPPNVVRVRISQMLSQCVPGVFTPVFYLIGSPKVWTGPKFSPALAFIQVLVFCMRTYSVWLKAMWWKQCYTMRRPSSVLPDTSAGCAAVNTSKDAWGKLLGSKMMWLYQSMGNLCSLWEAIAVRLRPPSVTELSSTRGFWSRTECDCWFDS